MHVKSPLCSKCRTRQFSNDNARSPPWRCGSGFPPPQTHEFRLPVALDGRGVICGVRSPTEQRRKGTENCGRGKNCVGNRNKGGCHLRRRITYKAVREQP